MTDPAAAAARAAAVILAPDLGPDLPAQVEAALLRDRSEQRPTHYDPLVIIGLGTGAASLIVSIAQLAWAIYSDQRKRPPERSSDSIGLEIRMTLREQAAALPPGSERITDVIVTEIIRISGDLGQSGRCRSYNPHLPVMGHCPLLTTADAFRLASLGSAHPTWMDKGANNPKQCPGGLTRSQRTVRELMSFSSAGLG
jgi:hypothetical protein